MTAAEAEAFAWGVAADLVGFVMLVAVYLLGMALLKMLGQP